MNVIKNIGKLIWSDQTTEDMQQISSGQFYIHKPSKRTPNARRRECLFIDSMATIRRTEHEFQFILAISRQYAEGEKNLADEDDEDEKAFLVDEKIHFRESKVEGATAFMWEGISEEDEGLTFEFVCDDETTAFKITQFELTMYQCMYERKYQTSHFTASEDDIIQFQVKEKVRAKPTVSGKAKQQQPPVETPQPVIRDAPPSLEVVVNEKAELHLFNASLGHFEVRGSNTTGRVIRTAKYSYWLVVIGENGYEFLAQPMEPRMNPVFSASHLSFIWNYFDEAGEIFSWLLRFPTKESHATFQAVFGQCMYEALNHEAWAKVNAGDQNYIVSSYNDSRRASESSNEGDESDDESFKSGDESEEESEDNEEEDDDDEDENDGNSGDEDDSGEDASKKFGDGDRIANSQLVVGYKDRSFVVRGAKVGVFKQNDRSELTFDTTIRGLKSKKGKDLTPSKMLLHEQDSSMVFTTDDDPTSLYRMDLNRGTVVDEWNLDNKLRDIVGDKKYSKLTPSKTLIGVTGDSIFRLDTRLQGAKVRSDTENRKYKTVSDFSAATSTANGSVAVANSKGEIWLYDQIGKDARTKFAAFGVPIIGLDVTGHGQWLLATSKECLFVVDTQNKVNGKLGFNYRFLDAQKPEPTRLSLKPQDVALMGGNGVNFTPARFNQGENEEEKTIVTSTGPFVVTWNFRRVKNGHTEYQFKYYDDNVIADNFQYGHDRSIVVALPNDVTALPKTGLSAADHLSKIKRRN